MEATLGHHEYINWLAFLSLFDLPDPFMVVGVLGSLVANLARGKGEPARHPGEFAPWFARPKLKRNPLAGTLELVKAYCLARQDRKP